MAYHINTPRFPLGRILATPGVLALGIDLLPYLRRHHCGDWGDLCDEDKAANGNALEQGSRILSHYNLGNGVRIYIITEWDRSVTTILLPEEY
ncbi:MAG: hypothetical protein EOP83_26665 [Verrucomicrobiaceae bacterium]|nr:MAG: hypothetical protein EOP83_26665 [Verrucomicrobiaceae bacterium]